MTDLRRVLGDNIRSRRRALGLKQEALASITGYTRGYVCNLEHARQVNPTLGLLEVMAAALGCTVFDLLTPHETG